MANHRDLNHNNSSHFYASHHNRANHNGIRNHSVYGSPPISSEFDPPTRQSHNSRTMTTSSAKKIFFIRPRQESTRLNDAFTCLHKDAFQPIWIKESEIDAMKQRFKLNTYIVVMDMFDGEIFERLKDEDNVLLLSAYALIAISPKTTGDIPFQRYPLESLCMVGFNIFLSGFPKQSSERREIKKKIRRMGGEIKRKVRQKSTKFIVATSWTTGLCSLVRKDPEKMNNIPIMSPEWVEHCYNQRENLGNGEAKSEKLVKKFSLRLFAGMCITPTGFEKKEKEKIGNIVKQKGGKYDGDLLLPNNKNILPTSHLIVKKHTGPKYEEALRSPNIHLVNLQWLMESCKRVPPYPYLEEQFSVRPKDTPDRNTRDGNQLSNHNERAAIYRTCISEVRPDPVISHISSVVSGVVTATADETYEVLQRVLSDKQTKDTLFEGLAFYFCGVPAKHQCLAKNLIKRCGGTVYDDLTCVVTHIILGVGFTRKESEVIKRHEEKNHATFGKVSIRWITDCWAESQQLPETYDDLSDEQKKLIEEDVGFSENNNHDDRGDVHKRGLDGDFVQAVRKLSTKDNNARPPARNGFTFGAIPCSPIKKIRIAENPKNRDSTPGSSIPVLWGASESSSRRLS